MSISDGLSVGLTLAGAFFFLAGTLGLLRFPDVYTRLHALTKADNLGLGLIVLGLLVHGGSWFVTGQLLLTWLLVMVSSATACHLIARAALRSGVEPWERS